MLFGFSGLFAKLIGLPAPFIVLGRSVFAVAILAIIIYATKNSGLLRLKTKRDYCALTLLGGVLALHWSTFFYAIQASSVAIGLLSTSTFPVFAAFLEPLIMRKRIKAKNVILAAITLYAISLMVPHIQFNSHDTTGMLLGLISGFSFALLIVLNKHYAARYSSLTVVFYQTAGSVIATLPVLFFTPAALFQPKNIVLLAVLGVVFTAASHTLFVKGMAHVNAQIATVLASLEPVYGILIAIPLLGEMPTLRTIVGGVIILTVAYIASSGITIAGIKRLLRPADEPATLPNS